MFRHALERGAHRDVVVLGDLGIDVGVGGAERQSRGQLGRGFELEATAALLTANSGVEEIRGGEVRGGDILTGQLVHGEQAGDAPFQQVVLDARLPVFTFLGIHGRAGGVSGEPLRLEGAAVVGIDGKAGLNS